METPKNNNRKVLETVFIKLLENPKKEVKL